LEWTVSDQTPAYPDHPVSPIPVLPAVSTAGQSP
jgi:hypothetical protein